MKNCLIEIVCHFNMLEVFSYLKIVTCGIRTLIILLIQAFYD